MSAELNRVPVAVPRQPLFLTPSRVDKELTLHNASQRVTRGSLTCACLPAGPPASNTTSFRVYERMTEITLSRVAQGDK